MRVGTSIHAGKFSLADAYRGRFQGAAAAKFIAKKLGGLRYYRGTAANTDFAALSEIVEEFSRRFRYNGFSVGGHRAQYGC